MIECNIVMSVHFSSSRITLFFFFVMQKGYTYYDQELPKKQNSLKFASSLGAAFYMKKADWWGFL